VPDPTSETAEQSTAVTLDSQEVCVLPTSVSQERFWTVDQLHPGTSVLNVAVRFVLDGKLETELVERGFNQIVARHESLRTTFIRGDGLPMQVIAPSLKVNITLNDLRSVFEHEREREIDRLSLDEAQRSFDLSQGPLLRITLVRVADEQHLLLLTAHHSVVDYWSVGLMISEFATLYEAYRIRSEASLPQLRIQYGDFAVWDREQIGHESTQTQLSFWKKQLADLPELVFPTDFDKSASVGHHANIVSRLLPLRLTNSLKEIANREGATFFNIMLAALAVVVHRYTGQSDFGIGTQVAGRQSVELESLVGLFINTVVLRADLNGDPSFRMLLGRIQGMSTESLANSDVRFEQVLKEVCLADYPNHEKLFSLNFICQRDEIRTHSFDGIKLTTLPSKSQGALYDLNVFLILRKDGWRLSCEYKTGLFEEGSIVRLLDNYQAVLDSITEDPELRISQLARVIIPATNQLSPGPSSNGASLQLLTNGSSFHDPNMLASEDPTEKARHDLTLSSAATRDTYAFPITLNQQRFWILDQLMPGNPTLNMPIALRLDGLLRGDTIRRSLCELVRRHETLRTTFSLSDGHPVQEIHPPSEVELTEIDLESLSESDRESRIQTLLHEEAIRPFDLSKGPLFRTALVRLARNDHVLLLTMPHIVCDGWSNGIVVRELTSIYEAFSQDLPSPLPELSIQYADFAHWQNEWLKSASFDEDLAFWKKQLHGRLPLLDLPADRCAPPGLVSRGATETLLVPPQFVSRLKDFCKREGITMFMLLLAGFKAMLSRLSGQEDILVGSPIAGRMPDTEGIVGPFSYPISLRTDLSGDPTFRELTHRIRDVTVEALTHKDLPFGRVLEELGVEQLRGRNPLFQIYFLHQVAFLQPVQTSGLTWNPYTWASPGTAFDLHLATVERTEGIINRLEYNPDMFEVHTVRRMLRHYQSILTAIVADPELRISELPLSAPIELELDSTAVQAGKRSTSRSVLDLLKEQTVRAPKKTCCIFGRDTLSYQQLDTKSGALAEHLRTLNLDADSLVGICCDPSPSMIVAMIGALKAGYTYVWFPPNEATESSSMRTLLGRMKVVISDMRLGSWFADRGVKFLLPLQSVAKGRAAESKTVTEGLEAGNPACVRLTTGARKAAVVTHDALAARAAAAAEAYMLTSEDCVALISSAGIEEAVLSVLTTGATAVFVDPLLPHSGRKFAAVVEKHGCSVLVLTARHFEGMVTGCEGHSITSFKRLRIIAIHGDKPAARAIAVLAKQTGGAVRFVSAYGTAETGSNATNWEAPNDFGKDTSERREHLGPAAGGFEAIVVDHHLQPAPVGVVGEICVGGQGLARSYLGDTELTAEKFFGAPGSGRRFFKTGDLGRYRPDGQIDFLGPPQRHSHVRGFRRHFSDLEFSLMQHPRVECAVAMPSEDSFGIGQIVAYIQLKPDRAGRPSPERDLTVRAELQAMISQHCEGYPNRLNLVFLDDLRLNRNGNADSSTLPHFNPADANAVSNSAGTLGVLESKLIEIWEDLLGIRPIGITDNFFDLGGHSLLALRLFNRINALWGKALPLSTLFQAPTISHLAEILRRDGRCPPASSLVAIRSMGARPPLYIISGIGGNVVRFHTLARYLNPDLPLYALQPPGIDGNLPYLTSIEEIAAHYIREIKVLQPRGPYCIAGYSFGGLVAFEMGRELAKSGDQIGLLALLDSPEWHYEARAAKNINLSKRLGRYRDRLSKVLFEADRIQYLTERLGRRVSRMIYSCLQRLGRNPRRFRTISDANAFAASIYTPGVFPGRLILFRTRMAGAYLTLDDPAMGWGSLASEIQVHEVPGDHDDMTAEPHVRILAQKLETLLIIGKECKQPAEALGSQTTNRNNNDSAIPAVRSSQARTRSVAAPLTGS
jgi:non-ribosomal peptide synthetase component F/thioesterase domain-containing protein